MKRIVVAFVLGALTPLIAGVVCAWMGFMPVRGTSKPSWIESAIARRAVHARISRDASGLANPLQATDSTLLSGMELYRNGCAGCHGEAGKPSRWGTKNFYPRVPQFADEPSTLTAPEVFVVVKHGVRYSGMAGWDGLVADEDIWRVAMFLSRISTLPPGVAERWTSGS